MQKGDVLRRIAAALGVDLESEEDVTIKEDVIHGVDALTTLISLERIEMFWMPASENSIASSDLDTLEMLLQHEFPETEDDGLPTSGFPPEILELLKAVLEEATLHQGACPIRRPSALRAISVLQALRQDIEGPSN